MATPEITTVTMTDGRVVDFPGKRKMQKSIEADSDGFIIVRLDFLNGETRSFPIAPKDFLRYAMHGASQKIGDAIAGLIDVDDCVATIDDLLLRLGRGEWTVKREAGSFAGASILAKALCEYSGKDATAVKEFLSTKTQSEKMALRSSAEINPIILRLEAEKAANSKAPKVDTSALLGGLSD